MRILSLLLVVSLFGCASSPGGRTPPAGSEYLRLTIVGTNDVHGWLMPHEELRADGTKLEVGGFELFGGYLKILREQNPGGVVLVDGGDLFQGTLASNLSEGAAVVDAFNLLDYDAVALGNHEFDFGPVGPRATPLAPDEDALGALKERARQARFPILAANVHQRGERKTPGFLRRSVVVARAGVRVGIIGLATPETPEVTPAANIRSLLFLEPREALLAEAKAMRADGIEVILLVAHLGGQCLELSPAHCEGPLLDLVRSLPDGTIDAALGGHTHRQVATLVGEIPVLESEAFARSFGLIELYLDPRSRKVLPEYTQVTAGIELCERHAGSTGRCDPVRGAEGPLRPARFRGRPVVRDLRMTRLLEPHLLRVESTKAAPLGTSLPAALTRDYDGESAVGNLVASAMLAAVPEAQLAITNSGGLRADLPEGELRYGHLFEVIPFDNHLAVMTVEGKLLRELIRVGFAGIHGGLQLAGAAVTVDLHRPGACATVDLDGDGELTVFDRDRVAAFTIGGNPLDDAATYTIVTSDFLAGGGSGWATVLRRLRPKTLQTLADRPNVRETFVAHLRGKGQLHLPPVGGRVSVRGSPPRCPPGR